MSVFILFQNHLNHLINDFVRKKTRASIDELMERKQLQKDIERIKKAEEDRRNFEIIELAMFATELNKFDEAI